MVVTSTEGPAKCRHEWAHVGQGGFLWKCRNCGATVLTENIVGLPGIGWPTISDGLQHPRQDAPTACVQPPEGPRTAQTES